jgi:hypothetical protein
MQINIVNWEGGPEYILSLMKEYIFLENSFF